MSVDSPSNPLLLSFLILNPKTLVMTMMMMNFRMNENYINSHPKSLDLSSTISNGLTQLHSRWSLLKEISKLKYELVDS